MALDPRAKALLDQMAAANLPPIKEQTPQQAREGFARMQALAGEPEPVAAIDNLTIAAVDAAIPIRIYRPAGAGPFPVLVYFHGGGWVVGDLESMDAPLRALTNRSGCLIISVDYRLAPEHTFPTAAEDAYAATCWATANAARYQGDPTRLAAGGDSAGGNLAAVVALMARDRGGPPLAFQLLVYPATDARLDTISHHENGEGYLLTRESCIWFWGHYLRTPADGENPYASPLRVPDLSGLPAAMIITAEYDPLRDEGEAYAERLRRAGVPVELRRYDGMIHAFFQLGGVLDQGRQAIDAAAAALRGALAR